MPMANSVGSSCKGTTGIELVENLSLVYGQKEVTFSRPDLCQRFLYHRFVSFKFASNEMIQ